MSDEFILEATSADIPDIEDGVYAGKLTAVTAGPEGQYGPSFRWEFDIQVEDGVEGIDGLSSRKYGPAKAKATQWVTALLGEAPERIVLSELVGKPCRILVDHNEAGWPRVANVLPRSKRGA